MRPNDSTILYLEDEIIIALDTAHTLEEMGFRKVHVVHNIKRASATADRHRAEIRCALLDVNIAGEGLSLEFGRGLLERGIAVVFASGYNRHEMEAEYEGLTFVEKPLSAAAIADAFARLRTHGPNAGT